jgi:hypothetical protein
MGFAMDMVPVGQEAVSFFNHVGGEGLARDPAETRATKAANDATERAIASTSAYASALANLDGRNNSALSMSYYHGKNHE